jgi:uncharacterized protein YjiS (DUF1127 family)
MTEAKPLVSNVIRFIRPAIVVKFGLPTSRSIEGNATMSSTTIDATLARRAGLNAQSWPQALARAMRRGIAGIASRRRLRRHIEALAALDDRTLGDIGLSRGEIRHALPRDESFDRRSHRLCS